MKPVDAEELRRLGILWFGNRGWQSRLAEALGVDRSQVSRWSQTGHIPGPVQAALTCWRECGCRPQAPGLPASAGGSDPR